ncbi:partial urocanate hydratase, partial [Anaerolineae bacterium]
MRMFMNNLDPEVAEDPANLIVYGGRGQAARSWEAFDAIIRTLQSLENDETLLVQSGKPVGVLKTTPDAPRVLIANSNLVPHWATQEHFDALAAKGLMMYGQMTAGSWIYIGTQGILQGTYETLAEAARRHFNGTLRGTLTVTAGLGGMGGAQPLAVTMNEGVCLIAEVDEHRIQRRIETRYLDEWTTDLEQGIQRALEAKNRGEAISIGVLANASDLYETLLNSNIIPEIVTDQTPAHDVMMYVPTHMPYEAAVELRTSDPAAYHDASLMTMRRSVEAMVALQKRGSVVFDYGNNIRQRAYDAGFDEAF